MHAVNYNTNFNYILVTNNTYLDKLVIKVASNKIKLFKRKCHLIKKHFRWKRKINSNQLFTCTKSHIRVFNPLYAKTSARKSCDK